MYVKGGINMSLYVRFSLLIPVCAVYVCVCAVSNQIKSKNHVICDKPSVNLIP